MEEKPSNRNRNVIWFNPPYNKNIKINVVKIFIDKHFPNVRNIQQKYSKT